MDRPLMEIHPAMEREPRVKHQPTIRPSNRVYVMAKVDALTYRGVNHKDIKGYKSESDGSQANESTAAAR